MKRKLIDRKNPIACALLGLASRAAVLSHFRTVRLMGRDNVPRQGPFLLVSNHVSRWDGLLLHELVSRPSNWMVSPNELLGLQGFVLRSMGAFPASARYDLLDFAVERTGQGEGIVIFPEGDIKRDGTTHPFKSGAARLALICASKGVPLVIVPAAIHYPENGREIALAAAGETIAPEPYLKSFQSEPKQAIHSLTVRLHREVCHLRHSLGSNLDDLTLFQGKAVKSWAPPARRLLVGTGLTLSGADDGGSNAAYLATAAAVWPPG